eukprot:570455-Hanusia_phi.AAC.3
MMRRKVRRREEEEEKEKRTGELCEKNAHVSERGGQQVDNSETRVRKSMSCNDVLPHLSLASE